MHGFILGFFESELLATLSDQFIHDTLTRYAIRGECRLNFLNDLPIGYDAKPVVGFFEYNPFACCQTVSLANFDRNGQATIIAEFGMDVVFHLFAEL
jgi:hypothetical protein